MKPEKVFKRYDIRGKYPQEIDEEFAEKLGRSFAVFLKEENEEKVVVTRDNKDSSEDLKSSLIEGLSSSGIDVLDGGIGPTDLTAYACSSRDIFSIQVTSSHLPLEFNGFKFMYPDGNGVMNPDMDRIKNIFRESKFIEGEGKTEDISENVRTEYIEGLLRFFKKYFESIDRKIVLETMGGASSGILPEVFERLDAEFIDLSKGRAEPIDPPNPKPGNLRHVEEAIEENKADIGLATDMDADRVALYYQGEWVDGNDIFGILAKATESSSMVASIDTSKKIEDVIKEIYYTRVGDPFVIDATLEKDVDISGEPNGHYCFPEFVAYNSGSLSAILLAAANLEKLLDKLPDTIVKRSNIEVEEKEKKLEEIRKEVEKKFDIISEKDGVKFETENAVVLIRPSGSSPVLRLIAEADKNVDAEEALSMSKDVVHNA